MNRVIMESQKKYKPTFSIEFFPPKTEEGKVKLRKTREELAKLNPAFISVTGENSRIRREVCQSIPGCRASAY